MKKKVFSWAIKFTENGKEMFLHEMSNGVRHPRMFRTRQDARDYLKFIPVTLHAKPARMAMTFKEVA